MAQAFDLTAQLQLQSPRNVNQVVNDIRRQLKPIGVQVKIENTRNLARGNKDLATFSRNARNSNKNMSELNRTLQESARRFSVITIATGSFLALANAFKKSVKEAVAFERELVRISQVTGKTVSQLSDLSGEVTRLSTTLGASSSDLLNVARTLTQAGFAATETRKALDILAKTSLGATFDNIQDTTEGAIALLRQFGNEAKRSGGDIKFLESSLDAINSVSKRFAVESGDLISAIRRTGGVFAAAGGSVNELIALFTSVRATTRESAETIATGLRTIFTRIQRVETIEQLKALNIQLQDSEGRFVGAFEAIKRLSEGLKFLDPRDFRFSQVVEELGGFRQIGKVIPLINQFATAQEALNVAQGSSGSVSRDALVAQQSLGVQVQKVREQFDALIRKFADSSTFRSIAGFAINLAEAFIKVADSLEPLLPLLVSLVGLKLGQGIAPALAGIAGIGRRAGGSGPVTKFARGGMVPGSGNRDTVPAMLTPGEFVIRKSSVQKLGSENLARMNEGRAKYNNGTTGTGAKKSDAKKQKPLAYNLPEVVGQISATGSPEPPKDTSKLTTLDKLRKISGKNFAPGQDPSSKVNILGKVQNLALKKEEGESVFGETRIVDPLFRSGDKLIQKELSKVDGRFKAKSTLTQDGNAKRTIGGFIFESFVSGLSGIAAGGEQEPFDFKGADTSRLQAYAESEAIPRFVDAKRSPKSKSSILAKALNERELVSRLIKKRLGGLIQKFAAGGIVGQKAAGAAILDPDGKDSISIPVSVNDVKKEFGSKTANIKFARGKDPFAKRYSATNFKVARQGLNKKTSDKFRTSINDAVIAGLDSAGTSLGADLGLGAVTVDQSTKQNFINSLRAAQIGDVFENILSTLDNRGKFDSAIDPNRAFDFPAGLGAPLKDNFDSLPSAFIDAKTSFAAANEKNIKGKIVRQIKQELIADGVYNDSPLLKAPKKKAAGGGISGSDTVPALLTPGEFVFNKGAAQSIGYGNLNRMNKQGVQGFAKGGAVGIQSFNVGGPVASGQFGISSGKDLALVNAAAKQNADAFKKLTVQISSLPIEQQRAAVVSFGRNVGSVGSEAALLDKSMEAAYRSATQFSSQTETLIKREAQKEQKLAQENANRGAGETRGAGSVKSGLSGDAVVAAEKKIQALGITSDESSRVLIKYKQGISKGLTEDQALQAAQKDFQKRRKEQISLIQKSNQETQKNNTLRKKLGGVLSRAGSGLSSTGGAIASAAGSKEGAAAFTGQANQMAGAAQQFVFLGASVAALTGQMSGLEDSTKKAINEVAGFATGIVGIGGTLVQVLTSFATASSQAAIASELESQGSLKSASADELEAASSKRVAAAGLAKAFGFVAIAVVAVGAALKFFSSKAKAEADELTKGVSDRLAKVKEEGGTVGRLTDLETAAGKRQFSEQTDPLSVSGGGSVLAGAAGGAAIGAFFGPVGIAVGGALGAIAAGVNVYTGASEELSDATRQQIETIRGNIGTLEGLYNSSLKADQALADIDATKGLTSEEKASRLTGVSRELGGDAALPAIQEANVQLAFLASSVGKKASELQESDFEGEALLQFQTATAQAAAGQESIAKRAKVASDALSEAISATDGTKGFQELIAEGGTFAQAFRQAREATVARTQAEIDALERSGASQEEINAARKRGSDQLKNLTSGTARVVDAQKTQREELIKAKEAAAAFRAELAKGKAFTASLEAQGRALERQGQAIDDFTANLEGRSTEFKAQEIVGLDNVGEVQNLSRFFAEIDNVAAQAGPEAQKSAEALKKNAKILKGSSILEGIDATVSNLRETVVGSLSAVGVSAETFGGGARGKSIFDNIVKELEDGAQEAGGLTKESIDKALSPVAELVDQQANNFKLINNNQNAQLANYSKFLDAQDALFNKELEGRSRIAEVAAKGAELRAKARGEELSPQAQEAARRRQAQVQLAGTGLRAGDVRQVSTAKQQAKQALANIQAQKAQANAVGLSVARRKELAKQERQQLKVIKAANGELERLADQSDRASSILSQIDEERQKRQVQFDLLQEFVVGGQEERGALNEAALGIQNAIKTGTLQGQSAEQRSATVGLLDKLENIVIPGTLGLTGKEVKQELVFRDAISLGLDPKIAQEIATATSKEEQLINSLDRLTNSIEEAARARPLAGGGLVQYRANGGSIFQPKGTDTVPAMLTPGEFVIRKSAVDKVGLGALQAINEGGAPVYAANGTKVKSTGINEGSVAKFQKMYEYLGFGEAPNSAYAQKRNQEIVNQEKENSTFNQYRKAALENPYINSIPVVGEVANAANSVTLAGANIATGGAYNQELVDLAYSVAPIPGGGAGKAIKDTTKQVGSQAVRQSLKAGNRGRAAIAQGVKNVATSDVVQGTATGYVDSAIKAGAREELGFARGGVIYRQQGGGVPQDNQINALNQQISGGKVNIVGRDKIVPFFKSAIYDNLGAKGFLSLISQLRSGEFKNLTTPQKRELAAAINNRSLPIESFRSVAAVESLVGLVSDNSNIFDSAGGGSFTLRAPNFADPASVRKTREIYKNLNTSIISFAKNADFELGQKILKPLGIDLRGQFDLLNNSLVSSGDALGDFLNAKDNNQAKAQAQAAFGFASKSKNVQAQDLQEKIKEIEQAEKENKIIKPYKNKGEQARALKNLKRQLSAAGGTGSVGSIVQLLKLAKGGQVPYFASGGGVGGDSVPAMLTPGEFVMNANTVKKHGVGFMNRLNKGNLPGFNKGGIVGGVQYKQDGGTVAGGSGSLTVETSRIQGVFDGFVSNFSSVLDNIVAPFNNVVQNLNQLSQAFGNLTMQHTVNVEGLISVGGLNIDSIKNELSQSIGEMVAGEVQRVMNDQQKNFKSN